MSRCPAGPSGRCCRAVEPCRRQHILPRELGGGISNLDTFCSKSQAHFSNLLSLTQIQNNTRIKNNNNNKKAQRPRQSTPAHTYLSPEDRARERAAHGRREPRCLVHGWEAVRGQEEDPEGRSHPVPGAEANKAPCAHSLLHRSAKGAIWHDRGKSCAVVVALCNRSPGEPSQ